MPTTKVGKIVLVVGSGGREHAIAFKLSTSLHVEKVYVAPGNGGSSDPTRGIFNITIAADDISALIRFAKENLVSMVVVGPEQPLVLGLADACVAARIPCFGPDQAAAKIEASKAWSKRFMSNHGIPTALFKSFTKFTEAEEYLKSIDYRVVVKASGLAAGKGVIIPQNNEQAIAAVRSMMVDNQFGTAGSEVVIEEFMTGEEVSLLAFCDGVTAVCMPAAQDHKRALDGDLGLNTGGMGAYAPAPILTPALQRRCAELVQSTVTAMASDGTPFHGVLYAGFMLTAEGPKVLEYNCRFGDPETQALLPLLKSDLYEVMRACCDFGGLADVAVEWATDKVSCTVVIASGGYPESFETGLAVTGIDGATAVPDTYVFHAGTKLKAADLVAGDKSDVLVTSGGRVLAVTGIGFTLSAARSAAYAAVDKIQFQGKHFRTDIAHRALSAPLRLGVLGSTRGSSLEPVLQAIEAKTLNAEVVLCISNKNDTGILDRARDHNIPAEYIPSQGLTREKFDELVSAALNDAGVQVVLLVGYMRILSKPFVSRWRDRCINVHPSLLPDFAGGMDLQVHEAVIAAGKTVSGCTVHFVTEEVDAGRALVQLQCAVSPDDTPESLKARVQALEGVALIQAVEKLRDDLVSGTSVAHGRSTLQAPLTYKAAGVDIDAGEALVEAIKPMCKSTRRAGCDAALGGFGGLFDLKQAGLGGDDTVLVSGADGVGTKLKIAQAVRKHDTVGIDLVAMNVNDILVCGAEPLFFLDYYATGALDVHEAAQVVSGIAEGCRQAGAALIGGETAEMAGMYRDGEYDLAGFAVGAVKRDRILPRNIGVGDKILGLTSSGVHSNGFSLVRKCVERSGLAWFDPAPFQPGSELGEALLCPTKIYVKALLPLIKAGLLKGMAHITGGGLLDNLPRVLPEDTVAVVDATSAGWQLPPVFRWLQSIAKLPQSELLRTFNCGLGMVIVVAESNLEGVLVALRDAGEIPLILGHIAPREGQEEQVKVIGDVV